MKFKVLRANPSGNMTLYVLSPIDFDRELRPRVAAKLIECLPELKIEQVGFVCSPKQGGLARMEMAGGEFCGNATRAFGMLVAREYCENYHIKIEASGCDDLVAVDVNWSNKTSRVSMPLPLEVKPVTVLGHPATLVNLGNIAHIVIDDTYAIAGADSMNSAIETLPIVQETFKAAESLLSCIPGLEAWGVIFLTRGAQGKTTKLTPVVRVPSVGTLMFEGSCGSGTLAAALAQCTGKITDGAFCREYLELSGTIIRVTLALRDSQVKAAYINGPVELDEPFEIDLDLDN